MSHARATIPFLIGLISFLSPTLAPAAQTWPAHDVTIVVPEPPGGSVDAVARSLAVRLQQETGKTFIINNMPGASGMIGAQRVVRAAPDGYTLLFCGSASVSTDVLLFKHMPYDPIKDLRSIALVADAPSIVTAKATLPISNIQELIAYAKASPKPLNLGVPGIGTMGDLAGELLQHSTNLKFTVVPYQGSAPVTLAVLNGTVDVAVDLLPTYIPYIKAGTVKALGVTTLKRSLNLPDVPTIAEQGMPGFQASAFFSMNGPAKLSPDIVNRLNKIVNDWLQTDQAKSLLKIRGLEALGGTPDDLKARVSTEIEKWRPIVKAAGISLD